MKYILVLYDYDSNLIAAQVTKSSKEAAIIDTYESIYTKLTEAGITPILQYLDNENFTELIVVIKKKSKYQLTAPHNHSLNLAERAVSTFKYHFDAILAGCTKGFPKYLLWSQLVPQAVVILNMLGQSRINLKLSAHNQVFGTFNYQRIYWHQ